MIRDIDGFLKVFCEHGEFRPSLRAPFLNDGIYASDGTVAIRIDESLYPEYRPDRTACKGGQPPKVEGVLCKLSAYLKVHPFSFQELRGMLRRTPMNYEHTVGGEIETCEVCWGDCVCECSDCGAEHDCGACEGKGEVEGKCIVTIDSRLSGTPKPARAQLFNGVYLDLHKLKLLDRIMRAWPGRWVVATMGRQKAVLFTREDEMVGFYVMPLIP